MKWRQEPTIMIIDDGVNQGFYQTGKLRYDLEVTREQSIRERENPGLLETSHGSICAAIIQKYAPRAPLASLKILNERGIAHAEQLIRALQWCADHEIQIVHLSLGTIQPTDFPALQKMINLLANQGTILVAAANNGGRFTYPAALSNVIGVRAVSVGELEPGEFIFHEAPVDGIDITTSSQHSIESFLGRTEELPVSNSYAAPFVTAVVYQLLEANPSLTVNQLKLELKTKAKNSLGLKPYLLYQRGDWFEEVALICMGTVPELTLNLPTSLQVRARIDLDLSPQEVIWSTIQEQLRPKLAKLEQVDTVVVFDYGVHLNGRLRNQLCQQFDQLGKNIIYLDRHAATNESKIDCHLTNKICYPPTPGLLNQQESGGKGVTVNQPIIAIYDYTRSELERLMDELRGLFRQDQYNPLVVTNSPAGIFFDFETVSFDHGNHLAQNLSTLEKLFDPGVILLGVSGAEGIDDLQSCIRGNLEIDIAVYLYDQLYPETGHSTDGSGEEVIILARETGQFKMDGVHMGQLWGEGDGRSLYELILDLYAADDILI